MQKQYRPFLIIICVLLILQLCSCSSAESPEQIASTTTVSNGDFMAKSDIAAQPDRFIPIEEVGTFNPNIITKELLTKESTLPEASNSSLPYWTGFILENKIWLHDSSLYIQKSDGQPYFYEDQIRFISENGFNCVRVLYSFSFLSNPDDINEINLTELEELDELIAWGMKYDVHVMLSITGLPGQKNKTSENVSTNDAFFSNPEMNKTVTEYFVMLANRYAEIPNRNFSIELFAEPTAPNYDLTIYEDTLIKLVNTIREVSPERIMIVNDLGKQIPERLAEIGCPLSLHIHICTIDHSRLPKLIYKGHWPMEYLPSVFNDGYGDTLTLKSESSFKSGKLRFYIYLPNSDSGLKITADDTVLVDGWDEPVDSVTVSIPEGTKVIKVSSANHGFNQIEGFMFTQDDSFNLGFPVHDLYTVADHEQMPTILIKDDGTTENADNPQFLLNSSYFYDEYISKFTEVTEKYHVGFLLSEVGTDTRDLPLDQYLAYESEWLDALKSHNIPWMWNYLDHVCSEINHMKRQKVFPNSEINYQPFENTPMTINMDLLNFLKSYR